MLHHRRHLRRGFLAILAAGSLASFGIVAIPAANAANPQITVNLASSTGAVTYGASGCLYGLANDGTPTYDTLSGLKMPSVGQMAPGGSQHPDGDALKVGPEFFSNDGSTVQVYMQDYYSGWPYPNPGITSYLSVVTNLVNEIKAAPNASKYVFVPFNEPDWIWYGNSGSKLTSFENDWKTVYQKIRSLDSSAVIAGPNFETYNNAAYTSFYTFAKANNVLPNITTWHELDTPFTDWYTNYNDYRAMESSLGIGPLPININEYGRSSGDMGIPGQMIQYLTRFENSRVSGNMAAWGDIGDLCQLLTDSNFSKASAWYLYRWYGERTGNDVSVTLPSQTGSLQALASLASTGQQATVMLGGSSGSTDVVIKGFSSTSMGSTVHVAISSLANSGGSASSGPTTSSSSNYTVSGGQITVTVPSMVAANAYDITVTAGSGGTFDPNATHEIANVHSGLALEDNNHGTADGSVVDQWTYGGSSATHMRWYLVDQGGGYYKIINAYSGKALDDYNNATGNGAVVDQWSWTGGSNQLWSVTSVGSGHYEILNKVSGKALDDYNNGTANGSTVDQWAYSGGSNQQWTIS